MTIRPISLPRDADALEAVLSRSFVYPENPEWSLQPDEQENLTQIVQMIRRFWFLIRGMQTVIPAMRNLLNGFLWEEDGQPAGVVLAQPRGSSATWVVTTVATLPAFRRRGIARKVVSQALDFMRQQGAATSTLAVIDGNLPAYTLYQELGFSHYGDNHEMVLDPQTAFSPAALPEGYQLTPYDYYDWEILYTLEGRIMPMEVQRYEPVEPGRYQQPGMRLLTPLFTRIEGRKSTRYMLTHHGEVLGAGRTDLRTRAGGRHHLFLRLEPAHAAAAPAFLDQLIALCRQADPELLIEFACPGWQPHILQAALEAGFSKRITYRWMGLEYTSPESKG